MPPKKRVAKPRLQAAPDELGQESTGKFSPPGEWASLLGDLSPGDRPPEWRVHDRTHLELAVDYPLSAAGEADHVWEAYFFVPTSLRLNSKSYSKEEIYRDFQSWVRFAVNRRVLSDLTSNAVPKLAEALAGDESTAVHELRIFASEVRTALLSARRHIELARSTGEHDTVEVLTRTLLVRVRELLDATRAVLSRTNSDGARISARWIDEDLSLVTETVLASLSLDLRRSHDELAALVAAAAVHEARYRQDHGLDGVGHAKVSKREIEHLEFRRHVLKRFTASALQAETTVSEAGHFTLQFLYAIAASIAMSFAVVAAAYHGTHANASAFQSPWMWAAVVVLAYAGKDRIKATLQGVFARWVAKHLPDRVWRLRARGRDRLLGSIKERSAFIDKGTAPAPVMLVRNSTRQHALEEHARPEEVLWHQKICRVDSDAVRATDDRFAALTEVFRLDLRRWLVHTDDPKQRIVFADPDDAHVYAANAPRVYNIAIVYRLRRLSDEGAAWKRIRVIVSRKGIQRIEHVS